MTHRERSLRRVADTVERHREAYGDFPVVEKTWVHDCDTFRALLDRFREGGLGGAGVWITDDAGRVLLVRNEGDRGWGDPGGKVEPGESFEAAARREVREEAGVECAITDVLEVHVVEHCPEDGGEGLFDPIVTFAGDYRGGEPRPREGEIAAVDWFGSSPDCVLYEEVRERFSPASDG